MPTHNDETLLERYQREAKVDERIAEVARSREKSVQHLPADDTEGGEAC